MRERKNISIKTDLERERGRNTHREKLTERERGERQIDRSIEKDRGGREKLTDQRREGGDRCRQRGRQTDRDAEG